MSVNDFLKRKDIRLKSYDYSSNGFYFVNICTYHKRPMVEEHRIEIEKILLNLPKRFLGLSIDYYSLMSDHVHMILIFQDVKVSLSEVIRTFKSLVSKTIAEGVFWQRNYYEHVIRTEDALNKIREYIRNNPLVEKIKFDQFYGTGSMNRTPTTLKSECAK